MKTSLNALISALTALLVITGVYYFVPLGLGEIAQQQKFGSTVTTINGSDTLSSSRTVINNNFAALNTGKFELSDWYATTSAHQLSSLGTITTGTWNASAIGVPYGGSGTTTFSSNQVLLGNGTSGVKTPVGWGTSGQFLTSNGSLAAPSWQSASVDQTANYTWTGTHAFQNTVAIDANVSHNLTLNSVPYSFPSSQFVGSLQNSGSGALSWGGPVRYLAALSSATANNGYATTTALTIPANTLTSSSTITFTAQVNSNQGTNNSGTFYICDSSGVVLASASIPDTVSGGGYSGVIEGTIYNNGSRTSQGAFVHRFVSNSTSNAIANDLSSNSSSFNTANALNLVGVIQSPAATNFAVSQLYIVVNQ